ncbi:MAG: tRNA dihydrouridine synthase DusB [Spirochaetales bacterium]|nr:tRNA dihydrouridine synthase DusB [Spirochaetales bacterium]
MNNDFYHSIQLPGFDIPGNLFLAPMAGWTDKGFRSICVDHGADMCFSEMISAVALDRNNDKTLELAQKADNEKILALQLFGYEPKDIYNAIIRLELLRPDMIDLNCGCPVTKVIKTGAGAALAKQPSQIVAIVKAMREAVRDIGREIPISVKIRSGWDHNSLNYLEIGKMVEDAGADMITLHSRTRSMGYSGNANYQHLAELVSALSIPVIGSGDLFSPEDALRMFSESSCDGVMFARGAEGNPFIFEQTKQFLANGEKIDINIEEKILSALKHLEYSIKYYGEEKACREMRKHICAYTKGITNGNFLRQSVVRASTYDEYREKIDEFLRLNN